MRNKIITVGILKKTVASLLLSFCVIGCVAPVSVYAKSTTGDIQTEGGNTALTATNKNEEGGLPIPFVSGDAQDIANAVEAANAAIGSSGTKVTVPVDKTTAGGETTLLIMEAKDSSLIFYPDNFKKCKQKTAKKALNGFIDSLKDSGVSSDTQQNIMTQIQDSDSAIAAIMLPMIFDNTKADIFTAYKWLYPILQGLRVLLGVGSIFLIVLLLASTVMDCAYIGLPMWRETKTEKSGGKKPFGVSYEALATVQEVEKELGDYKNPYILYIKKRGVTYVVLAICILYLVVGEIGGLIGWVLNLASGVVGN